MKTPDLKLLQRRIAESCIGPSSLRNQGAPGVLRTARDYLAELRPRSFDGMSEKEYRSFLQRHTVRLSNKFPGAAKGNWGAARKALNLFFRDMLYNSYFIKEWKLHSIARFMEVPLDKDVALSLRTQNPSLPQWPGIKNLTLPISNRYQSVAQDVACDKATYVVHLDLEYWRSK